MSFQTVFLIVASLAAWEAGKWVYKKLRFRALEREERESSLSYAANQVNDALLRLMDALCTWERGAGRRSTLLLIPHDNDERIVIAIDGKPFPERSISVETLLKHAMDDRSFGNK